MGLATGCGFRPVRRVSIFNMAAFLSTPPKEDENGNPAENSQRLEDRFFHHNDLSDPLACTIQGVLIHLTRNIGMP